jgi:WD40 repeat protein
MNQDAQTPRKKKIFISYGHDDFATPLAKRLKKDLENLNHIVWFDEEDIKGSYDWQLAIEKGIETTDYVIAILTPHAVRRGKPGDHEHSDGVCLDEISYARFHNRIIVPLMVKECTPPLSISRIQWIDAQKWHVSEEIYKNSFKTILGIIEGRIDFTQIYTEGLQARLISELNPLDFGAEIDKHVRKFMGREWLFERITKWIEDPNSKIFFLTGKPGVGKSAIASWLCHTDHRVVAFHFCKHNDKNKNDAKKAVLSIAYQLSQVQELSEYKEKLSQFDLNKEIEEDASTLADRLLLQPLSRISKPNEPKIIVIDALDEATKGGKNLLVDLLSDLMKKIPNWLKFFITSRPEYMVLRRFKPYTWELNEQHEENERDVEGFAKRELEKITGTAVSEELIHKLYKKSEGIFLYVTTLLELEGGKLDLQNIDNFPQGLFGIYDEYFQRYFPDIDTYKEKLRSLLQVIIAAYEPLSLDLLENVLKYTKEELNDRIAPLGSLFPVTDEKIYPFHKTIVEWLTDRENYDYYIDSKIGHEKVVNYGWELTQQDVSQLPEYFLKYLPQHLLMVKRWEDLTTLLSDLFYIDLCCQKGEITTLIRNYSEVLASEDIPMENVKTIREFQRFIINQAHLFRKYAPTFPQFVAQQAINQPDTSVLSVAGRKYLNTFESQLPWFEWKNKPQELDPSILTFTGHSGFVNACAFSSDGTRILSASDDKTLKLWDVETGTEIHTFSGHTESVNGCAFSPDGTKILSSSADKTLKLWDTETGTAIRMFSGHTTSMLVESSVFSPDGTKILSASGIKTLKLWDTETGTEIRTFTGHPYIVLSYAFSPDGTKILSASNNGKLKLWDTETGTEIRTFFGHDGMVRSCAISPDGTKILSAGDYTLKLCDAETGTMIRMFSGHTGWVTGCAFSPDGTKILSASQDKTLKLWDTETGTAIRMFSGIQKRERGSTVQSCEFSPDEANILSASTNGNLKFWDAKTGAEIRKFSVSSIWSIWVQDSVFSPDGTKILSASDFVTLKLQDAKTGAEIRTFTHSHLVYRSVFSPDGTKILSASADKTLKLWDAKTGAEIRTFTGHSDTVYSCAFSPDGTKILSASLDNTLKLWDAKMGAEIHTFSGHTYGVIACAFSPDGTKILSASSDCTLKLWDAKTGAEIRTFTGHSGTVWRCAFSPDGTKILSASADGNLKLWDAETGTELMLFLTRRGARAISVSNSRLVACGDDGGSLYILQLHYSKDDL